MATHYTISQAASVDRDVDVLVLGGGMSGVFAAIGAAEDGHRVAIVEPSNVLGGQGTSGGVAGFVGDTANVNHVFDKLVRRLLSHGKIDPYSPNDDRRAYDLESCAFALQELVDEAGVEIWLHSAALDVRRSGTRIEEVLVRCGPSLVRVRPKFVIDATGNAVVPHIAGCETVHLGPLKQLPMSLYFTLWNSGREIEPYLPHGCPRWETSEDLPMTSLHAFDDGRVEVKMKVVGFDAADGFSLSRAEIHARRQMMGLVYHLQTKGYQGRHSFNGGKPLSTYTLASVSRAIGQREGRRIVGHKTLSDDDVKTACVFEDAVAVGTYHLDFHWTNTEKRAGTGVTDMVEPYHIPLGAMCPEGLDNVLCPGRSLSGDQLALSSYRAMATCAQMGFGAGKAIALAITSGETLASLDFGRLRAALDEAGQSLDLSRYGDYLRCIRAADEIVPDLVREGEAHYSLTLKRADAGRTYLLRSLAGGEDAGIALRQRMKWVGLDSLPTDIEILHNAEPDADGICGRECRLTFSDGQTLVSAHISETMAADGDGVLASCAWASDQVMVLAASVDRDDARLVLMLANAGLRTVTHYRVLTTTLDRRTRPALIPTATGIAVAFEERGVGIRFVEGSIERLAEIGQPPVREEFLQALPYQDHVLLSNGGKRKNAGC